jgi:hypothetical protein
MSLGCKGFCQGFRSWALARHARVPRPRARRTWERCGASSWALKAKAQANSRGLHAKCILLCHACLRRPRWPASTLRAATPCMHSRTLAPCEHAVGCVLCVGCSTEAGSHSSRPHSSPTLIMQERQSFSHMANGHMANGHSAGVDRPHPLANVCGRDLQIPEIGYQTCNIKSGPAAFGRLYQLPLLSISTTATVYSIYSVYGKK